MLAFGVADDESALVTLHVDGNAPALNPRAPGPFHFALLLPSRRDLAYVLPRLSRASWPLSGASDHLASESLYVRDPDGNGIEIYRDRADCDLDEHGRPVMGVLPLDLRSLSEELFDAPAAPERLPAGTRMGHVHLQVSDFSAAEAFYCDLLGFDVVVRAYPHALLVTAGAYHHRIGLNTWNSAGADPPIPGAVGLRQFEMRLPGEAELERVLARLREAGVTLEAAPGGTIVRDPSTNTILLRHF